MIRLPRLSLHAFKVRRFIREIKPDCLVYNNFEYNFGRAISYGARTAGLYVKTFGTQDCYISKRRLANFNSPGELKEVESSPLDFSKHPPMPDYFLLESQNAVEALKKAGYPHPRLFAEGAPRVNSILDVPRFKDIQKTGNAERLNVLFIFSKDDGLSLMRLCLSTMKNNKEFTFILKLHPRGNINENAVKHFILDNNLMNKCYISEESFYNLLPKSNVVLGTYSSCLTEAAVLGYPVVGVLLPNSVNIDILPDINKLNRVKYISDISKLEDAIKTVISSNAKDDCGHIEEYCFNKLDKHSCERWADRISTVFAG